MTYWKCLRKQDTQKTRTDSLKSTTKNKCYIPDNLCTNGVQNLTVSVHFNPLNPSDVEKLILPYRTLLVITPDHLRFKKYSAIKISNKVYCWLTQWSSKKLQKTIQKTAIWQSILDLGEALKLNFHSQEHSLLEFF